MTVSRRRAGGPNLLLASPRAGPAHVPQRCIPGPALAAVSRFWKYIHTRAPSGDQISPEESHGSIRHFPPLFTSTAPHVGMGVTTACAPAPVAAGFGQAWGDAGQELAFFSSFVEAQNISFTVPQSLPPPPSIHRPPRSTGASRWVAVHGHRRL